MGLRRAMAIEQLESGARTERYALVVGVGEVELSVHYNAKLHMVDPAVVETRRRGRADQIGEGDAVCASAGQRRRAISAFADAAPNADGGKPRVPEADTTLKNADRPVGEDE